MPLTTTTTSALTVPTATTGKFHPPANGIYGTSAAPPQQLQSLTPLQPQDRSALRTRPGLHQRSDLQRRLHLRHRLQRGVRDSMLLLRPWVRRPQAFLVRPRTDSVTFQALVFAFLPLPPTSTDYQHAAPTSSTILNPIFLVFYLRRLVSDIIHIFYLYRLASYFQQELGDPTRDQLVKLLRRYFAYAPWVVSNQSATTLLSARVVHAGSGSMYYH
ncbi:unnamed protein product [Prorocentrum cordatum]|uniref:Peroxisomal membrane protein PEX16 n=1 Tax=Prorocentrum cordatum TaxID=2364126 RepID=A0ABN9THS1_9DINO|nr:unnamed protein product [Polarella glacialis]